MRLLFLLPAALTAIPAFYALTATSSALAQEEAPMSVIYDAGEPQEAHLPTEAVGFPDIYTRQLAYREQANKMRALIAERQQNFQAPAYEAREQYAEDIKELNTRRGTQNTAEDSSLGEGLE